MFELVQYINDAIGTVHVEPYSMEGVFFFAGVPPLALKGVNRIVAWRDQPKKKLFSCLSQGGAFVNNRNLNGFVAVEVATGSPAHANLQILDISGIGFPVRAVDTTSIGASSFFYSLSAGIVTTPQWVRAKGLGNTMVTMACKNLLISGGVRKIIRD